MTTVSLEEVLPASILAHILSYLIESSRSIAPLRRISKSIRDAVIPLLPVELLLAGPNRYQLPSCTPLSKPFVTELLDYPEENDQPRCGDRWLLKNDLGDSEPGRNKLFAGFRIVSYFWLDDEPFEEETPSATPTTTTADPQRMQHLCLSMIEAKDVTELQGFRKEANAMQMFHPTVLPPPLDAKRKKKKDELTYRCIVTLAVQKDKLSTLAEAVEGSPMIYRVTSLERDALTQEELEEEEEDGDEGEEQEEGEGETCQEQEEDGGGEENRDTNSNDQDNENEEEDETDNYGENDDDEDEDEDLEEDIDEDMENLEFEEAGDDGDFVEYNEVAFGEGNCDMLIPRYLAGGSFFAYKFEMDPVFPDADYVSLHVPLILEASEDDWYEVFYTLDPEATSLPLTNLWNGYQHKTPEEGVVIVDGIVPTRLKDTLKNNIDILKKNQNPPDYHPHSDFIVRDLVHPALYAYVKDVSPLVDSVDKTQPCVFWNNDDDWKDEDDIDMQPEDEIGNDAGPDAENSVDYWGRKYEASSNYQWLPTYFHVDEDGRCTIQDYINNLAPRENYEALYCGLEELFRQALPFLESVYSYCRGVRGRIRQTDAWPDEIWDDTPPCPIKERPTSLRGQKLQVITKIVDYELKPGQTYSGVWHVEGMSHEEIVATALYVLDRDDEIEGGDIMYKRAFHKREAVHIFSTVAQCRPHHLEKIIMEGLIPVGSVGTPKDRLVVFPNSHVHRVKAMKNVAKDKTATRRIVVFFLVNPERRIVSTREVPPQQQSAGGNMSLKEAMEHREKLMVERKYSKQDWNVREIELCEH